MLITVTDHTTTASRSFRLIQGFVSSLQKQVERAVTDFPLGNACADRQDFEAFILFERCKEIIHELLHPPGNILTHHAIREDNEKFIAAKTNIERIGEMFFDEIGSSYKCRIAGQMPICVIYRLEMIQVEVGDNHLMGL